MHFRDEVRPKWRESIERGWLQAQSGDLIDGDVAFHRFDERIPVRRARAPRWYARDGPYASGLDASPVEVLSFYSYVIVYDPATSPFEMIAILHGAQDVERLLEKIRLGRRQAKLTSSVREGPPGPSPFA